MDRETANGKEGMSGGVGWNAGTGFSTLYTGINYDTLLGAGVDIKYKEGDRGNSFITGINGSVGWNAWGGFQSSLSLEYSAERLMNMATLNGDVTNETRAALNKFDLETQGKTPLEKAELKKMLGLPLTRAEQAAYDEKYAHVEANREMGAGALSGLAAAFGVLGDDIASGWDRVTGAIGSLVNSIGNGIRNTYERVGNYFSGGSWETNMEKHIRELEKEIEGLSYVAGPAYSDNARRIKQRQLDELKAFKTGQYFGYEGIANDNDNL
ncbi:hypothetical protein P3G55_20595 [Leptospira sp. 96542]|nr:hypothetical protein [Leptospira sp. 96542]